MARKRKNDTNSSFSWRYVVLHPALWFLLATGGMMFVSMQLWQTHYDTLIDLPEYQLSSQQIQVNAGPAWVPTDLEQAIYESYQEVPSLLDLHLIPVAVAKCESFPWVEKINRVEKVDAGLKVDLTYRRPVGLVEILSSKERHVVDHQAVLMDPKVMNSVSDVSLLRISVAKPKLHAQSLWTVCDDQRIIDAAEICGLENASWGDLGCYRIVSWDPPGSSTNTQPFEIWPRTARGTKVVWGSAPGKEKQGEASAVDKLQALKRFLAAGQTDADGVKGQKIDVRSGTVVMVDNLKTAREVDFFDQLK